MATNDEVASHLGISPTRVSELKSAGILPEARRRANNLTACRGAYLEHLREIAAGRQSKDGSGLDLVEERARLARAQAEHMERKNAVEAGEFIRVASFHRMATASILIVRGRLLGIPPKLAPLWSAAKTPAEAQEILRKEIYATLDELAATDLAKYDHSDEFASRSIADLLHGDQEATEG